MSRFMRFNSLVVALLVNATGFGCHGVNPFAADLGATRIGDRVARAPYMSQHSYFGYIDTPTPVGDKGAQAVYFWLPTTTPELGVRFISGRIGAAHADGHKDVQEPAFVQHRKDTAWFDPAIEVQRCLTMLDPVDVEKPCGQWVALGDNDDSVELPKNALGKHTNSLVRISMHPDDPLKALSPGLYRVTIRAAKETSPKGTFVLQLGAPVLLDTVAMARTPEALAVELVKQPHAPAGAGLNNPENVGGLGTGAEDGPLLPPQPQPVRN